MIKCIKNEFSIFEKIKKEIELLKKNGTPGLSIQKLMQIMSYSKSGYYSEFSKNNIGDDFITSPLISSLFGYGIAAFLYEKWKNFFYKQKVSLIEFGSGTGKLMLDVLNFLEKTEMFEFISVDVIEHNEFLKSKQISLLKKFEKKIKFYNDFSLFNPDRPLFIFSNEFFDCLPINQFVFKDNEFFEIVISFDNEKNNFFYALSKELSNNFLLLESTQNFSKKPPKNEEIFEICSSGIYLSQDINFLLKKFGGLCLIFDYGQKNSFSMSSLQCIKNHKKCSVFECIENSGDISAHVNFAHIDSQFDDCNLKEKFLITQAEFFEKINFQFNYNSFPNINLEREIQKFCKNQNQEDMGNLFKSFYILKN